MQREVARRKFNIQPVICSSCTLTFPNYRMLISKKDKVVCYGCSVKSVEQISEIKDSFKEYYECLFRKIPLPDYKIAKDCLQTVSTLKKKTNELLQEIRKKLNIFENDLKEYFQQTVYICQGYIDKVKHIEESTVNNWHKHPPKLIDQDKFIFNIQQKQFLAVKIEDSLKELKFSLPDIEQIKKEASRYRSQLICNRVSITSAISVRGILYLGANDGRIIYSDSTQANEIKAHQSLIRDFQHDGQFKLFSSSDDQVIKMWDLREKEPKLLRQFGSLPNIRSSHRELALIDKGHCLASTRGQFDEYKIRIWDLSTFENSKTLVGHRGYIKGIVATKQNQLITVSEDRYLKIWNLKHCQQQAEYFHSCKLTHVFYNNHQQLICMIDEHNKVILLDFSTLAVFNGLSTGRKVQMASADTFIYIHNDRHLNIYNWDLSLVQKVDLGLSYAATNIIEMFSRLLITDANGTLHQFSPQCLNSSGL